jgi:hypothetical protein
LGFVPATVSASFGSNIMCGIQQDQSVQLSASLLLFMNHSRLRHHMPRGESSLPHCGAWHHMLQVRRRVILPNLLQEFTSTALLGSHPLHGVWHS